PNCPLTWNGQHKDQQKHTWKDFFMHKYGDGPYGVIFTVRFDHLTHSIGTIPPGSRYTMRRVGGAWEANGVSYPNGDPAKLELNVWGALLGYNEYGQVLWNKELVGTLRCGIGSGA